MPYIVSTVYQTADVWGKTIEDTYPVGSRRSKRVA
jgi:hypothetical protein